MSRLPTFIVIAAVAAALLAWVVYVKNAGQQDAASTGVTPQETPAAPAPPAPEPVVEAPPPVAPPPPPPEAPPLPALDESDAEVLAALRERAEPGLVERVLAPDALLRKVVATVDNLPRPTVSMKVRAVPPARERFLVTGSDGDYTLDPANYARYRTHTRLLETLSPQDAASLYTRYYPLLQEAYAELGYPDAEFHERVVTVIDELLATPDVSGPIRLTRPHVLYRFADPELEALSAGQKMLLRAGPDHARRTKAWLREFRAALAAAAG